MWMALVILFRDIQTCLGMGAFEMQSFECNLLNKPSSVFSASCRCSPGECSALLRELQWRVPCTQCSKLPWRGKQADLSLSCYTNVSASDSGFVSNAAKSSILEATWVLLKWSWVGQRIVTQRALLGSVNEGRMDVRGAAQLEKPFMHLISNRFILS